MRKLGSLNSAVGNVKWHSYFGKQLRHFLKHAPTSPCDPAILSVGIYLEEKTHVQTDACVPKAGDRPDICPPVDG